MDSKARFPFKRFGFLRPLSVLLAMTLGTASLRACPNGSNRYRRCKRNSG
ncbi:hypothetical protein PS862_03211 [Pseudomonas fluorescens]|uniref:Uncharacterized protein n=1 Tax=Pseudomonas fluorescens TaxID=294 RepID=A0A5E7LJV0_PSEFL|nr:hypothetical protein PS639_02755 [Pseudomonas fluorescens]VVP08134.1 hypothetical protein PS862_03211 [Pseudomonas fluorescens]